MNEIVTKLLASTAAIALTAYSVAASAQSPQAPTVAAGSISVTRQGATTVVTQGTEKGIIDWRSFSIGAQEAVRFDQPGRSSITLNRVTSSEISRIDGNLSATGQVWIANPNGVLIGSGGQVNVGGLLATTGRVDAAEFLRSGRASIDQISKDAAIVNQGTINIQAGGYAALAAAAIRNDGVIAARSGSVALGSGKAMTVDFAGDKLITFQVTQPLEQAPNGADALIANGGTITAQGGVVVMSARAAKGVMDNVINLKGHVVASSVKVDGGTVSFGDGGIVQVSGRINASDSAGPGGMVSVLGEKVGLMDGATIDASGATGGGTVLVGGDWQGKGAAQNAEIAYVAPTASINADATVNGNGGKVVVWADDATRFNGTISARGGLAGGDGGQVETSGKKSLQVGDSANVATANRAAGARGGAWLLDPLDITIVASGDANLSGGPVFQPTAAGSTISVGTINTALSGGDVTVQTAAGAGSGDITVNATLAYTGGAARTLSLLAHRDIVFSNNSTISFAGATHSIMLNARATGLTVGSIITGTSTLISTAGGSISLVGGTSGAGAATGGGTNASGVDLQGVINSNGGNIVIRGQGAATGLGVSLSGSTASITGGVGTVSITGTGGSGGATSLYGVSVSGGANVSTTNGAIIVSGTAVSATNSADGVNVDGSTIKASGTGAVSLTGARGAGTTSRNILIINSATVQTNSGALTLTGTSSAGGSGFSNAGVRVDGSSLVTTATGAISISGTGAAVNNGSESGIEVLNGGKVTATGSTGSITMTGVRGPGSSSSSNVFIGSAGATTISTVGGNITIDASAAADNVGTDNVGFNMTAAARITTAGGTISITGAIGGDGTGGPQPGVSVQGGSIIDATGSGAVTLTGVRGPAAGSRNIQIIGSSTQLTTIATSSGALTLIGTATTGGAVSQNHGVELSSATLSTAGGAIIMNGVGGGAGTLNHGVYLGPNAKVAATGAGNVSLTGTRGAGANSRNIVIEGSSGNLATLSTGTGTLSIDGSAPTVATGLSGVDGLYMDYATVQTTDGTISIKGMSGATTLASNGVSIYRSTIQNTGSSTTLGQILLVGNANGASGNEIYLEDAILSGSNRPLMVQGNAIAINGTTAFTTASTGRTAFQPRTAQDITVSTAGNPTTLSGNNLVGATTGTVEIGSSLAGTITVASGLTMTNNLSFVSGSSPIIFSGNITDPSSSHTLRASTSGTVTFGGNIGVSTALGGIGVSGAVLFDTGVTQVNTTGSGLQSYSSPVVLTNTNIAFNAGGVTGAIVFNGPVDSASSTPANHSNLTVSATGGVTFNNNFGAATGKELASFTAVTTPVTFNSSLTPSVYRTDGTQSYAGAVILKTDTTLTSAGGNLISFAAPAPINSFSGTTKSLTVSAGTISFGANIGSSTGLQDLKLTSTTNAQTINLPGVRAQNLDVSTTNGAITQGGAATITGLASLSSGSGAITLYNSSNNFNQISLTNTGAAAAIYDNVGNLNVIGASVGPTLTLRGQGLVLQGGPISTGTLSLTGATGTVFSLATNANSVGVLAAPNSIGALNFKSSGNLSVTGFDATTGGGNIESGGNLDITGPASAAVNLTLKSAAYMSYTGNLYAGNSVSLTAGNTITDNGTATLTSDGGPLKVTANGGNLANVTVQGTSGTTAATPSLVVVAAGSSITVNTIAMSTPAPVQQTPATVASIPTQVSVVPVASVASVATVVSVPTLVAVVTVPSTQSTPSVASFVAVPTQPNQNLIALLTDLQNGGGSSLLNQILAPVVKFDLAPLIFAQTPPPVRPNQPGTNPSAQSLAAIVTSTPPGAFIPQGPSIVNGTGATLASAPTIKIDLADSGGGNGQVIAFGVSPEIGGPGGPGASGGGGGGSTIVPGLLRENRGGPRRVERTEPPLSQQPSQMSEEPFLD